MLALAIGTLALINQNFWAMAALPIILTAPHVDLALPRRRTMFYAYYPVHLAAMWLAAHL